METKYITCQKNDRIGMQIYSRLWTIYFANQNSLEYVHTPLAEPFESVFNIGKNYLNVSDVSRYGKVGDVSGVYMALLDEVTILQEGQSNYNAILETGIFADFSGKLMSSIIKNYKPQDNILHHNGQTNICIHVRRADSPITAGDNGMSARVCTDNQLQLILDYIHEFISMPFSINIHTDGKVKLKEFNTHKMNINIYDSNTPELIAMNDMILCDILFPAGISSFSGVSGIYNKNLIVSSDHRQNAVHSKLYIQNNRKPLNDNITQT